MEDGSTTVAFILTGNSAFSNESEATGQGAEYMKGLKSLAQLAR
jgi:hypothetical protein